MTVWEHHTCCFFGHRNIRESEALKQALSTAIERLILEENTDTFLFGSKSRFNDLCYELVTAMQEKHPHIRRVYVRAEYADIRDSYERYLLNLYEETYFPEHLRTAGRAVYVERNCEMIDKSDVCVVYYDEQQLPAARKSGTKIALDYAIKQGKRMIQFPKGDG